MIKKARSPKIPKTVLPKISVITPSYNQGKYLERTILSVLNQGYPNLEYIIIDGGSTDESVKIIRKYQKQLHYWVSEKDQGQGDAINKGFRHSSGEIMTWINSDDKLMPGSLAFVAEVFTKYPEIQWMSGIPTVMEKNDLIIHRGFKPAYIRSWLRKGWYHGRLLGFVMQEGTFWRKELWKKCGSTISNRYQSLDHELWRTMAAHAELVLAATSLAVFRKHPEAKTARNIQTYYDEIGARLPEQMKLVMLPIRFVGMFLLRKLGVSSEVYFDTQNYLWKFRRGWFMND